ncbi:MAG: J domain-containing protein [Chloroflexi bacterium]|nr:J domain-containing protein [Chloroflexota bacterium]
MAALLKFIFITVLFWFAGQAVKRVLESASRRREGRGNNRPLPHDPGYADRRAAPAARSPYEVLDVSPEATPEEVRAAYRRKVQQYHPDKVADLGPEIRDVADKRMKEINAAYEELKRRMRG